MKKLNILAARYTFAIKPGLPGILIKKNKRIIDG
jgi:hypothetical protein